MKVENFYKVYIGVFVFIVVGSLGTIAAISQKPQLRQVSTTSCVPIKNATNAVGGLGLDVPRLSGALRFSYNGEGTSQYTVRASTEQIIGNYLGMMADECWKLVALSDTEGIWSKEKAAVKISAVTNSLSGKSLVTYSNLMGGRVLGAVRLAQADTNSGVGDGSANLENGTTPSANSSGIENEPPTDPLSTQPENNTPTSQNPTSGMTGPAEPSSGSAGAPSQPSIPQCGESSYWCFEKNQCLPSGSPCGEYKTYRPGEGDNQSRPFVGDQRSRNQFRKNQSNLQPKGDDNFKPGEERNESEEEFSGQNDNDEEQQKRMDEERLKQMKRGLSQFSRGVDQMTKMVARMEKQFKGTVGIPAELKAALERAPQLMAKIKAATSLDELEEVNEEVMDVGETMQEWGPRLGDLQRLSEMLKRSSQEIKRVERKSKSILSRANKKTELVEAVVKANELLAGMKQAISDAGVLAKTDPEAALEKIEDGVFGMMEEYWNQVQFLEMVQNMSKGLKEAKLKISSTEKRISALSRSKKTSAELVGNLKAAVTELKGKLAEVNALAKSRPIDQEALREAGEGLWESFSELENMMAEAGDSSYMPQVKGGPNMQFEMPEGFGSNFGSENL